jgi:hypothetical protein
MTSNRPGNQDPTDEHFEERLREFRPIATHALAIPRRRAPWTALAVAACVLLAAGTTVMVHRRQHTEIGTKVHHTPITAAPSVSALTPLTLWRLNAALGEDDKDLNLMLDEASARLLRPTERGTALFELGKD